MTTDLMKKVEEDVLRIIGERGKTPIKRIKSEIKVSTPYISKSLTTLEKGDLIKIREGHIELTKRGRVKAKEIVKRHRILEDYLEKTESERGAHETADILEHYISKEVIEHIKKLSTLKTEGFPLTKLALNKEGIITDILFPDYELFERIVSMGIVPSEKIKVMYKIPGGMVIYVGGKKFALGNEIAKRIKVLG
jgi:DtxR family Mn-dependent transcriptional regulator